MELDGGDHNLQWRRSDNIYCYSDYYIRHMQSHSVDRESSDGRQSETSVSPA